MTLSIPDVAGLDTLSAALAYAAGGFYVVPISSSDKKNPGSVLRADWHHKSSRDPQQITAWYAGTDHGIALHLGRSGAVAFDVDHPDAIPEPLGRAFGEVPPPVHTSRPSDTRRGHYLYAQPAGRTIGNGTGRLGKAWGEVRGLNGVIVVEPSAHQDADDPADPGRYAWGQTGALPELPASLAELLVDATPGADAATDAQVRAFGEQHTQARRPHLLKAVTNAMSAAIEAGGSRHQAAVAAACWAAREAAAGLYPARAAADAVWGIFEAAIGGERHAASEYAGIWSWAIAQATTVDPTATRAAVEQRAPASASASDDAAGWAALGVTLPAVQSPAAPDVLTDDSTPSDGHDPSSLQDAHLAETVAARALRGRYCWAAGLGWLRYTRGRWKTTTDAHVTERIRRDLIAQHAREAAAGVEPTRLAALGKMLSAAKARALLTFVRGILEHDAADFDHHPDLLCVGNGVVDLRTGQLHPHDPTLLLTRSTAVDYRPGAASSDWTAALQALPGEVGAWMQVRIGQAATGHPTSDDVLPVLQGSGSNGKTTLMGAVVAALGEHAVNVPERVLLASPSDHPTELMTLRGARLALIEETPEGQRLSVKRLKDTLGTPTMTARAIRQDNVTWKATHSLMLTTNYTPTVTESDHGTWRRLALVKFPYTFTAPGETSTATSARQGVAGIRERLAAGAQGEHEAVLAWVVDGARVWYARQRVMPSPPAQVVVDTRDWRGEADLVLAYLTERLVPDVARHVASLDLFDDFTAFTLARGQRPWSEKTLLTRFAEHADVAAANVTRTRRRASLDLSRPGVSAAGSLPLRGLPTMYTAWVGIRFRTPIDDEAEAGFEHALTCGNVNGVQGVQVPSSNASRGRVQEGNGSDMHTLHTPSAGGAQR